MKGWQEFQGYDRCFFAIADKAFSHFNDNCLFITNI
jgi:hypothetical protein